MHLARSLPLCLVVAALSELAVPAAQAQYVPTAAEVAANAHRVTVLAAAAGITEAQAATVFAQMTPAPHAPRIHDVVSDALPDGGRNVFGLMDIDTRRECAIEDMSDACADRGVRTWIFFTHVSAAGAVERTGFDLPFGTMRGQPAAGALGLRLFAPGPSLPRIALVEGAVARRGSYVRHAWVWNGRSGTTVLEAYGLVEQPRPSGEGANLVSVAIDEAGRRFVVSSLECEGACRCTVPRSPADEAAQLARIVAAHPGVCVPRERDVAFPPGLRLVDDDLDADAVHGTEAELTAAIAPELARASGLTAAQASAVVPRLPRGFFAPRFSRFVTVPAADGTRSVFGLMEDRFRDLCVVRSASSRYDAIRACAYNDMVTRHVLAIRLSRGGDVTDVQASYASGNVVALYVVAGAGGAPVPIVELLDAQETYFGRYAYLDDLSRDGSSRDPLSRVFADHSGPSHDEYVGDVVAHPVSGRGGLVTLTRRRAACTDACPCTPVPHSPADARALLDARARAHAAACPVEESPYVPQ